MKWLSRILWVGTILGLIALTITLIVVSKSNLPDFADLENPQYDLASIIYDAQGEPFGKYYIENREFIDYQDLSPHVVDALLSVEDARYMKHAGIDFRALFRVVFKSILLRQGSSGGGSTISQQLAKLLFDRASLRNKSKLQRAASLAAIKMREWITAVRLERRYTKEEIIAMYLNKFEFINGAHGIQSASQIYFDKDQRELSITEAAVLVGMLKNPARFNPVRFAERTEGRRNVVLSQMYKNDRLSRHLRDSLVAMPMDMSAFRKADQSAGLAPYFRAELTKWLRPLLLRPEFEKPEGGTYDIYRDGLQIYTTIDARYQEHAEDAVFEHLKELQRRYWRRWKGMDPFTYEIEDDEELQQLRYASVDRRARDMEAYKSLYATMFGSLSDQARQTYGIELREPTVRRLVADREYVNLISANKQAFERLLSSNLWQEITRTWNEFSQSMEEMLDVEITSNMFSYDISDTTAQTMSRRDSLVYMIRHMQAGLLSVDPKSGEIKAWVGGPDHRYFKYDHVTMRRQVGSTIKPFVYATAIGVQGISPCQAYTDIQYTIAPGDADFQVDAEWSPSNSNGLFTQNDYNLYQGLLYSKNSITVRLVKELGTIEPIRELLHNV
ncbi:MAG: transglycosylase domain-containing protein, partial [Bacteroidota bacterium]